MLYLFLSLIIMDIIDEKFIKRRVSEERLFQYYFGRWNLNDMYRNPFRIDNTPTCNFFYHSRTGTLFFKDPAWASLYPSKGCFSVFIYVQFMFNLATNYDACYKIAYDFNLIDENNKDLKKSNLLADVLLNKPIIIDKPSFSSIKIKPKIITDIAIDFWSLKDYKMKATTLQKLNTYMISDAWINDKLTYSNQAFTFAYHLESTDVFQLYFPDSLNRETRFRCNQVSKLYCRQFVRDESYVILTKSYKDFIYLYLSGFNVCCILSENYKLTPEELAFLTKNGTRKLYLFYDYDKTGIDFSKLRASEYGCDYIFTEDIMNKDYSDMAKDIGLKESRLRTLEQLKHHGMDLQR